jgi:hypothetical protein
MNLPCCGDVALKSCWFHMGGSRDLCDEWPDISSVCEWKPQ